eukprot:jgi/Mesen1/7967/ME000422S07130
MVNNPAAVSGALAWGMNIFSSVGIIMVNKQLMSGYGFIFATTLTGLHFLVTGLVGMASSALGLLSSKSVVPLGELAWFSVIANLSIVGMNVSLMLNSVGFYQISKLSIIPTVCFFDYLLHGKRFSKEVKFAVLVVILGVGVCTVTDFRANVSGIIAAVIAVVATALQQLYIGSLQLKYNIGSFDLLSQTAPIQAVSLLVFGPVCDYFLTSKSLTSYSVTTIAMIFMICSCLLAVFCNLSQYLCIGKFSAVSFQVLGHMKTVFVLLLGWFFFDSRMTWKNVSGMSLAVVGMIIYSWAVEKGKKDKLEEEGRTAKLDMISPKLSPKVENGLSNFHMDEEQASLLHNGEDKENKVPTPR